MRKTLFGVLAICLIAGTAWAATMSVQVREVDVKSSPNYMSSSVGKLGFGSKVETGGEEGSWVKISSPNGWIPKTSLTKHSVDVNTDQKFSGRSASHDETALAGKGFNPQVEAEYKKDNPSMVSSYSKVDWLESQTIPLPVLQLFAASGKLER